PAATCNAPCNEEWKWFIPCQITRMAGSWESFESRAAARKSPFSSAPKTFSSVCGSRLRLSRHHQKVRSPTTATATMAVMRMGHMIGPPASKYFTSIFASIDYPFTLPLRTPDFCPAPSVLVLSFLQTFPFFAQFIQRIQPQEPCPEIHPPCSVNWKGT